MAIKKYVLISIHELTTTVFVDGTPRIVNFCGGSRISRTRGFLVTDNVALQNGVEQSSGFNKMFTLTETIEEPNEQSAPVVDPQDDKNAIQELTVTSKNKAIKYLMDTYNASFESTTLIEEMKKEALDKYNTVFVNW
ncbi:MAG: hypothetical protein RSB23_06770 [Alistipes sp.]